MAIKSFFLVLWFSICQRHLYVTRKCNLFLQFQSCWCYALWQSVGCNTLSKLNYQHGGCGIDDVPYWETSHDISFFSPYCFQGTVAVANITVVVLWTISQFIAYICISKTFTSFILSPDWHQFFHNHSYSILHSFVFVLFCLSILCDFIFPSPVCFYLCGTLRIMVFN